MVRVEFSSIRLTEVLKTMFFPITAFELLDSLEERGYRLLVRRPLPIPPTHRAYIGGRIAEKRDCTVFVDPDRRFIGVDGTSPENLSIIYLELIDVIKKKFELNLDEVRDYLELVATGIVRSRHMPVNVLNNAFRQGIIQKISEILGEDAGVYSVGFAPRGKIPSVTEWFDLRIEPHIRLPTKEYDLTIVYRSSKSEKVIKFFNQLESTILRAIKALEGEGSESNSG